MRFTDQFLDELRDRISISDVIGTRVTWDRAKTRPQKGDYWGCCPFHGESRPSFHCEDRKGRFHCFGCGASGDHFRFFTELDGVSFPRAVEMVASLAGVNLPGSTETEAEKRERIRRQKERDQRTQQREAENQRERDKKVETVRSIWDEAVPIAGTLAETYLESRSITLEPSMVGLSAWPPSLRFHPGLPLAKSEEHGHGGRRHPALIGGVQAPDRKLAAIWRIFLGPDGKALADNEHKKIKLGFGTATGGAVRFGPATPTLRLAEGMETALGVQRLTKNTFSVWATLSTSGMIGFEIPPGVRRLEIYADGDRFRANKRTGEIMDPPGIKAARQLQEKAKARGVEAVVFPSPEPDDWLDVWISKKRDRDSGRLVEYQD